MLDTLPAPSSICFIFAACAFHPIWHTLTPLLETEFPGHVFIRGGIILDSTHPVTFWDFAVALSLKTAFTFLKRLNARDQITANASFLDLFRLPAFLRLPFPEVDQPVRVAAVLPLAGVRYSSHHPRCK